MAKNVNSSLLGGKKPAATETNLIMLRNKETKTKYKKYNLKSSIPDVAT